jgi:hypothetical protein
MAKYTFDITVEYEEDESLFDFLSLKFFRFCDHLAQVPGVSDVKAEINQDDLITTIRNIQKQEEDETGVYCSWKDAKIIFLKELREEVNLLKDIVQDLKEPEQ